MGRPYLVAGRHLPFLPFRTEVLQEGEEVAWGGGMGQEIRTAQNPCDPCNWLVNVPWRFPGARVRPGLQG